MRVNVEKDLVYTFATTLSLQLSRLHKCVACKQVHKVNIMFTLYNNENDSKDKALFVNTTPNKHSSKSYDTSPGQTKRIYTIKTLIKPIEV